MNSQPTVGLFRAWFFRIWLLLFALIGFVNAFENTADRLWLSLHGVAATITQASYTQKVPSDAGWFENQHDFYVKATTGDGRESSFTLFLPRHVIETLVSGGRAEIIYARDNPRRHMMKGEPYPPFGIGWLLCGLATFAVFLFSLRLK